MAFMKVRRKRGCSDFLFPKSTFVIGMGSVLNIGGNYFEFNSSKNELEADMFAIKNAWECVGNEIRQAKDLLVNKGS
jgi:hypothetical protein